MKEWWDKHKANLGLAILVLYTLSLGVATADEVFHLGIFKTKLEKLIAARIEDFESEIESKRAQARKEILEYGDFAVPQLVKALDRGGRTQALALECLKEITDQNFDQPKEWQDWYRDHKDLFR